MTSTADCSERKIVARRCAFELPLGGVVNASLADAKIKDRLIELGGTAFPGTPSEFGAFIAAETAKWVKFANLEPE